MLTASAHVIATKTGLFLSNTMRDEARSLEKFNGSTLLSVAVEALKVSTIQVVIFLMRCVLEEHVRGQGIIFNHSVHFEPCRSKTNVSLLSTGEFKLISSSSSCSFLAAVAAVDMDGALICWYICIHVLLMQLYGRQSGCYMTQQACYNTPIEVKLLLV